ncbi:MAG: N-acyl homoserine lactonase family protein [Candidatus Binatus sp.]|uniref:N-acyl homoserine lactonase family protein n=1 Tax=Candidatus Binatus sp. TaxID=2811406 RepID=UPI003C792100
MARTKVSRMWALPGACLSVPRSMLVQGGDNSIVKLPCPSFLIEHPKGLVLFDTGCNPRLMDDPIAYLGEMARGLTVEWSKAETLDKQIRSAAYKTEDIKYVVLSHTHFDHVGGLTYFPRAKFVVGMNELRYAYWPDPDRRWLFPLEDYLPTRGYDWLELDRDFDLFGDASIRFLLTPGHTPGECSLLVELPNRNILLSGDTVHLREAVEKEATMPLDTDPNQSIASIRRIKAIRDMHEATLWISHDPEDWNEMPHQIG